MASGLIGTIGLHALLHVTGAPLSARARFPRWRMNADAHHMAKTGRRPSAMWTLLAASPWIVNSACGRSGLTVQPLAMESRGVRGAWRSTDGVTVHGAPALSGRLGHATPLPTRIHPKVAWTALHATASWASGGSGACAAPRAEAASTSAPGPSSSTPPIAASPARTRSRRSRSVPGRSAVGPPPRTASSATGRSGASATSAAARGRGSGTSSPSPSTAARSASRRQRARSAPARGDATTRSTASGSSGASGRPAR
mmetsp:Transcript_62984/g.184204  ORF Transcript_62984/g.184204 Transcript_62984/m.184204 type:complete len:256 (-) Transcript_62984:203-970(-)